MNNRVKRRNYNPKTPKTGKYGILTFLVGKGRNIIEREAGRWWME